jgi:hypothetical protein
VDALRRRAAVPPARRPARRSPGVVRAQVEEDEPGIQLGQLQEVLGEPVEAFQLDAARLEELGSGGGVLAGMLLEELVERPERRDRRAQLVRDVGQEVTASVAVVADDLDAFLDLVRHRVELERQLGQLQRAGRRRVGGHAPGEIALGEARLASVSRRSGVVNRRASAAAATTDTTRAARPMIARSPVVVAIAVAR